MDKKLKFIEYITAVFVLIVFIVVANKYFKFATKYKSTIVSTIDRTTYYLNLIINHDKYFGNLPIAFDIQDRSFKVEYSGVNAGIYQTQAVPVLLYHGVNNNPKAEDVTIDDFIAQMVGLKKAGYQTVTIKDFLNFTKTGNVPYPKSILITFDDGRKDSYYNTDPVLKILGFNAVMFAIGERSIDSNNSRYYLTEKEIVEMSYNPRWEIQSHGDFDHDLITINQSGDKGHFLGNLLWLSSEQRLETLDEFKSRVYKDLSTAKAELYGVSNNDVIAFAFPFGDFGQSHNLQDMVTNITKGLYSVSFIQFRPEQLTGYYRYSYTGSDNDIYKRILINNKTTSDGLLSELESGAPKSLPYSYKTKNLPSEWLPQTADWVTESSTTGVKESNNSIYLKAPDLSNTAEAYLDGTFHWSNYELNSEYLVNNGINVATVVRDIDGYNFLSCQYGNGNLYINQVLKGLETHLAKKSNKKFQIVNGVPINLKVTLDGNKITCTLNNKETIVSDSADISLSHGVVGYKIWGKEKGSVSATIRDIYAK